MKVGDKVIDKGSGSRARLFHEFTHGGKRYFVLETLTGDLWYSYREERELEPVEPDRYLFQVGDKVVYRDNPSGRVFLVSQLYHQDGMEYLICKPQDKGGPVLFQADSMKLA